jgi:hypothetical protein
MNKIFKYFFLFIISLFFLACEEEEKPFIEMNDQLFIGYWMDAGYTDSTQLFRRKSDLAEDAYSFAILTDGTFLENKNTSCCGTPPVVYGRYEGSWLEVSQDTLLVNTEFWGGSMQFLLIIRSVDDKEMEVRMEYLEFGGG